MAPQAPPSYFPPLSSENRCSSLPDYFYPTFHYHNKTHAWKKDKLKETAQPRTWIWEAYFHLSFLSFILLCCSFLFAQRNGKRHAFSFSQCLIMVLFRSALLYGVSPEPCTGIAERLVDYPDSRQTSTEPPTTPAYAPAKWTLNALISVAKEPCQDETYRNSCFTADVSVNNTSRSLNHGTAIIKLDRMYCGMGISSMSSGPRKYHVSNWTPLWLGV